jgi:hypothetical protein
MFSHPARHALLRADILVKLNIKRGLSPVVFLFFKRGLSPVVLLKII